MKKYLRKIKIEDIDLPGQNKHLRTCDFIIK